MANNNTDVVNAENMTSSQEPAVVSTVPVHVLALARVSNLLVTPMVLAVHYREKPEKFNRLNFNFKIWQQKMLFNLTILNLARFLNEEAPKVREDEQDFQVLTVVDAWKQSDYLYWNYIMNDLTDSLYS
ncbi:hypothetical protein PanWU01x14_041220, partial [Parasponia andersonii]